MRLHGVWQGHWVDFEAENCQVEQPRPLDLLCGLTIGRFLGPARPLILTTDKGGAGPGE